ncbi:hypothetical protein M413DRAFT_25478 [Hebeloma cylindrosporum]|uniref:non-specific serine/threonine protein kinase n=1 Tax=Hebeloma cylindrosporum TaxID=76867 RepID=A0A0C3CIK0_HEBCY|nr:hypothetical protein M413DRAFT_25478 [Hebeloma cylindrosporum h7]
MEILDDFLLQGSNGVHICVVAELLGPPILHEWGWDDRFREDDEEFPLTHAKRICAQAAQGLAYLHRCNIVHGDLNRGNLVLQIPGVERWTHQDVEKYFGGPRIQQLKDNQRNVIQSISPNVPRYLVAPPDPDLLIGLCLEPIENFKIKLCDVGETFIWYPNISNPVFRMISLPQRFF